MADLKPTASALQPFVSTDDHWTTEIVPRLPATRDLYARHYGALQRHRRLLHSSDLLRALLMYALGETSFRLLGAWAVVIGLADLSEAAWRKRLRTANAWLLWLLTELCAAPTGLPRPTARRVLLVDATVVGIPGGTGADWRVHTAYDFQAGRLAQVAVADRQTGEHLAHYALQTGDIVVADGGYGYRRSVALSRAAGADVVLRINLQTFPLVSAAGMPLDLSRWVATGRKQVRVRRAACVYRRTTYPVRVLALRLTPTVAQRARLRAQARAKKKHRAASQRNLKLTGWLVLVTTLDAEAWPPAAILELYRARWQVELVFKRQKSVLKLDHLRVKQPHAVEAVIRLILIAWLLQAEVGTEIRTLLNQVQTARGVPETEQAPDLSTWGLMQWAVTTLRQQVLGQWTRARVQACGDALCRFFTIGKRKRPHQESRLRHWLASYAP